MLAMASWLHVGPTPQAAVETSQWAVQVPGGGEEELAAALREWERREDTVGDLTLLMEGQRQKRGEQRQLMELTGEGVRRQLRGRQLRKVRLVGCTLDTSECWPSGGQ